MSFPRLLIGICVWVTGWCCVWSADFKAEPVQLSNGKILVAPHADSVVLVSRLWLILRGEKEDLTLNGQPLKWNKRFEGDVHVADLRLEIGMQRLKIGEEEVRFVLGRNEVDHSGPAEWQVYRLHNMKPGPNPCRECHVCEKVEDKIHVGDLNPPQEACFRCHERDDIQKQHANTRLEENWMESCSDCHFVHASPHKYLLRQPREQYLK
ncbi:MAG: hypothetical protein Q4E67_01930 [Planctomycetia bacterium]|nr:hypothetical protein [Planctomycetia bacterium]